MLNDNSRWILFAFAAMCSWAGRNVLFSYAVESAVGEVPLLQNGFLGIGMISMAIIYFIALVTSKEDKNVFADNFGGDANKRPAVILMICAGCFNNLALLMLSIAFALDPAASSISVAIGAGCSFVVALVCALLLKDAILHVQWAGILVTVAGIIIIGLSTLQSGSVGSVLYSLGTLFLFSVANVCQKFAATKELPPRFGNVLFFGGGGFMGLIFCAVALLGTQLPRQHEPNTTELICSFAAGLLTSIGVKFMNYAYSCGPAGPCTALGQSNAVLTLVITYAVFGLAPNVLAIVGMCVTLLGVACLSTGKYVMERIQQQHTPILPPEIELSDA